MNGRTKHSALLPNPWSAVMAAVLGDLRVGELIIVTPDGSEHEFPGRVPGPAARMEVFDRSLARRILTSGDMALAEGFMDGSWDSPDLGAVLDLGLANLSAGWATNLPDVMRPVHRLWHRLRDNDPRGGSRRNVAAHYDLGNDFYRLWLDDTMTYSSACFADEAGGQDQRPESLECAQRRKWDRVLDLVQPGSGDHLLEIGCGWGGFAIHAAKEAGCRVTGLTLSSEQEAIAKDRVAAEGLDGRVDVRLQDYREASGTYSGIVSIEMFEAVGEKWWPTFFRRLGALLEPRGPAAVQVITIAEESFEHYRRNPDFTQRYIFPGGMLPSPRRFIAAAQHEGLSAGEPRFFGADYARTLAEWARRFDAAAGEVSALGFDERFLRMWRYYLAYCKVGFEAGNIDVMQVRLER